MIESYIHYYNTQESSAQSGCADSDGETQVVPCCIKSGQQAYRLLAGKTLYFFTVLLTGSGSTLCTYGGYLCL